MKIYTLIGSATYGDYITDYLACGRGWKNQKAAYKAKDFVSRVFDRICAIDDVGFIIDSMKKGKTYDEVADELENNEDTYIPDYDDWHLHVIALNIEDMNSIMETE